MTRQLAVGALGLALLGTGACTIGVCTAIAPRTEVVDPAVRAPDAPPARVVALPAWRGLQVDTLSETRVRHRQGWVRRLSICESGDALVLRAVREGADEPETPLPPLRVDLASGHAAEADLAAWDAAGPETIVCEGTWGTPSELVAGDPWDPDVARTPMPRTEPLDSLSAEAAGAHVLSASASADGRALAVLSGAGPRTETHVILGGWEDVEGPIYLEATTRRGHARLEGPVALPPLDEAAAMGWPTPCWSPSGRAVVLPLWPGAYAPEPMRLAVLGLEPGA